MVHILNIVHRRLGFMESAMESIFSRGEPEGFNTKTETWVESVSRLETTPLKAES